jgi:transposase
MGRTGRTCESGIILLTAGISSEETMTAAEEKVAALRAYRALNPHPQTVLDAYFVEGEPFFDARDLVQVRYEMLRRVRVDGQSVTRAAAAFGFSRTSFYAIKATWEDTGLPGLLPRRPGPKGPRKLTGEVVAFARGLLEERPHRCCASQLVPLIQERFGLTVHPRSVERALARRDGRPRALLQRSSTEGWEPQVSETYERLRAWVTEERPEEIARARPPGLALLQRRGLPAAMAAWDSWLPPIGEAGTLYTVSSAPAVEAPSDDEEAVLILTNMVLSCREGVCP